MNKEQISAYLYDRIDYMYCDNCRFNGEEDGDDACDSCHRKYNGWAISKAECDAIAEYIIELEMLI